MLIQLVILLGLLGLTEFALRLIGYTPGDISPNWINFKPVDSLIVHNDFIVNQKGLLTANAKYFKNRDVQVNTDGFKTPEFSELEAKKRVMLIGDSFTWGMTAEPNDSCFAEKLRADTLLDIINLGIPAADPPQYELLAKEYLPDLSPDLVLVYFFMGNDLMKTDREPKPNKPFYFYTNAGAILTNIDGNDFSSAQEAYDYVVARKYHLKTPEGWLEYIVSKSSLLSRLYSIKFRIQEKKEYEELIKNPAITIKYLKEIVQTCEEYDTPLKIIVIPEIKEANMSIEKYKNTYSAIFNEPTLKPFLEIPQTSKDWFNDYPDAHLNNHGHYKYYRFSERIINGTLTE